MPKQRRWIIDSGGNVYSPETWEDVVAQRLESRRQVVSALLSIGYLIAFMTLGLAVFVPEAENRGSFAMIGGVALSFAIGLTVGRRVPPEPKRRTAFGTYAQAEEGSLVLAPEAPWWQPNRRRRPVAGPPARPPNPGVRRHKTASRKRPQTPRQARNEGLPVRARHLTKPASAGFQRKGSDCCAGFRRRALLIKASAVGLLAAGALAERLDFLETR
jgi:hypothetical protein